MKTLGPIVVVMFMVGIAFGGRYCPKKPNIQCIARYNDCCSDKDCDGRNICCDQNCGNTCRTPVRRPTPLGGKRVVDDPNCQLGIPKGRFCPKKSDIQCFVRNNKCCSEEDCDKGEICCDENCGNTCYDPESTDQGGTRVEEDYPKCQLGIVTSDYCPVKSDIVCIRAINRCCCDEDCSPGEICCQENCGNTCQYPVTKESNGTRVLYSSECNIDSS